MVYFDTGFLVPIILEEPSSDAVEQFIAGLPDGRLAVSDSTCVEFSSLMAREVRMGGLKPRDAEAADEEFMAMVRESFVVVTPGAGDFSLARDYLRNYRTGLRAGDALHLAIAKTSGSEAMYSLDKTLIKAGKLLGLPVGTGINVAG